MQNVVMQPFTIGLMTRILSVAGSSGTHLIIASQYNLITHILPLRTTAVVKDGQNEMERMVRKLEYDFFEDQDSFSIYGLEPERCR